MRGAQNTAVKAVREAAVKRKEAQERRRTTLLDEIANWKQAVEIRSYLDTITAKLSAGEMRITNRDAFDAWSDWAAWYADSIDPLTVTHPRPEFAPEPTNTSISELDLTKTGRAIVDQLAVQDTDELYQVGPAAVQALCGHGRTTEWNEICRVLEGLGYDVMGRYRGYYFWS